MTTLDVTRPTAAHLAMPKANLSITRAIITPAVAEAIIRDHLAVNRPMSAATIHAYAKDMKGGRWNGLNGAGISFNQDGKLIDGEHRVRAIKAAGVDVELLVFQGVDDEARKTMDDPRRRTAADELNMSGGADKLGIKLVSTLRALAIMGNGSQAGGRMSKSALLALKDRHPKIMEAVKAVFDEDKEDWPKVRPATIAALYYAAKYLMTGMEARADAMLTVMRTGERDEDTYKEPGTDPMHAWRELAIARQAGVKKLAEAEIMRGTLYAWELFSQGRPMPTKKFAIPEKQNALEALPNGAVFGDMIEGQPDTIRPAKPAPAVKEKPAKAPAAAKPAKGANKGKKGSTAKPEPIKDVEEKDDRPGRDGNSGPETTTEAATPPAVLNEDGTPNLDLIPDNVSEQLAASRADEARKLAANAIKAKGKTKGGKGTAAQDAMQAGA